MKHGDFPANHVSVLEGRKDVWIWPNWRVTPKPQLATNQGIHWEIHPWPTRFRKWGFPIFYFMMDPWDLCLFTLFIHHGHPQPTFLEVFMVSNLVFTWPKPFFFIVLVAYMACLLKLMFMVNQRVFETTIPRFTQWDPSWGWIFATPIETKCCDSTCWKNLSISVTLFGMVKNCQDQVILSTRKHKTQNKYLAILCDLSRMVNFPDPFKSSSDLQLGDVKVTLNHPAPAF